MLPGRGSRLNSPFSESFVGDGVCGRPEGVEGRQTPRRRSEAMTGARMTRRAWCAGVLTAAALRVPGRPVAVAHLADRVSSVRAPAATMRIDGAVSSLVYSPDGKYLAVTTTRERKPLGGFLI